MQKVTLTPADGGKMAAHYSLPKRSKKAGVIVFQEAFGVNDHIKDLTERFADQGFVAIAPEIYHRTAPEGLIADYNDFASVTSHFNAVTETGLQKDAQACYEWLISEQNCHAVAAVGHCMGGRAAFVANAKVPLSCAISYYGGRIATNNLDLATAQKSPLLFFWGRLDKHIPPEQIQTIHQALQNAQKKFTSVEISDADHGFFCDARPAYNAIAARQAWALTLQFLNDYNVAH